MKEKIWIEKLIELLNEFLKKEDKSIYTFYWNQVFNCIHRWNWERCDKEWICSKSFWFIKWLVENDKIEWETIWNYQTRTKLRTLTHTSWLWHDAEWKSELEYIKETFTDGLLMLLSISSSPIEDLISYLK